ncbi:MAG: hypothetical protein IH614_18240 [Desulfuromonadales bacterium]|nr:hypothetical protein [Desulfuromonadales bacterium]
MTRPLLLLLLLLPLVACGYHPPGRGSQLPVEVQTVAIEFFRNATLEPLLENVVTTAVSQRLIRGRALRVVDEARSADAVLTGEVSSYLTEPVAYDSQDEIARWRSTMQVAAVLRRVSNGEVLWKGAASWREEYAASLDKAFQEDLEAAAIATMGDRIAEELYFRMADNF